MKNPYKKKVKDILTNRNEFATWINKNCFVETSFIDDESRAKRLCKTRWKGRYGSRNICYRSRSFKITSRKVVEENQSYFLYGYRFHNNYGYPDDELYVESLETQETSRNGAFTGTLH